MKSHGRIVISLLALIGTILFGVTIAFRIPRTDAQVIVNISGDKPNPEEEEVLVNFSTLDGPIYPINAQLLNGPDSDSLIQIHAWANDNWSKLKPLSLDSEHLEQCAQMRIAETRTLLDFTLQYPDSTWTPMLQARLGSYYRRVGRYSLALDLWESAWRSLQGFPSGRPREIADSLIGQYQALLTRVGRVEALDSIEQQIDGRLLTTEAGSALSAIARDAQSHMHRSPNDSYRCGTYALGIMARELTGELRSFKSLRTIPSPKTGFSLADLITLGSKEGLNVVAVWMGEPSTVVVPSVVHWRAGHYAAITRQVGNWIEVVDGTFGEPVLLRIEDVLAEASGYFIVPGNKVPAGCSLLQNAEAEQVFGRGYSTAVSDTHDEPSCPHGVGPGIAGAPSGGGPGSPGGSNDGGTTGDVHAVGHCSSCGMPEWHVSEPNINLWIFDTPLSYTQSNGELLRFNFNYRQRGYYLGTWFDENLFTKVGKQWKMRWRSAVTILMGTSPLQNCYLLTPNDAQLRFEFVNGSSTSERNYFINARLEIVTSGTEMLGYMLHYADGSSDKYLNAVTNNSGVPVRFCLSAIADPAGREKRIDYFPYDSSGSLQSIIKQIVDIDGRTNSFNYTTVNGYTNYLSYISSYLGLSTKLIYNNATYQLSGIVDSHNITNYFTYNYTGSDWITGIKTAYGTTSFEHSSNRADHQETRDLTVTEPTGVKRRWRYESSDYGLLDPMDPTAQGYTAPTGTPYDSFATPSDRNSYYWPPQLYALISSSYRNDPTNQLPSQWDLLLARGRHWLGAADTGNDANTIGSERAVSPDGATRGQITWFDYSGKPSGEPDHIGTQILPAVISRVMPDGTIWYSWELYNSVGNLTNSIEKWVQSGVSIYRTNRFVYSSNGIELLQKFRTRSNGSGEDLLGSYGYTGHLAKAFTNGVGDVTFFGYTNVNHGGVTTPNLLHWIQSSTGLLTVHTYGNDGFRSATVEYGVGGAGIRTNTFTWLNGNLRTVTDPRGLTKTYSYDNLNRVVQIDYSSDNTYDQISYTMWGSDPAFSGSNGSSVLLNVTGLRDRLGNWTKYRYDGQQRLILTTDARNNTTDYTYCDCGSPTSISRASNTAYPETTSYSYDYQGRLVTLLPPGGKGAVTNYYDSLGRNTLQLDAFGTSTNTFDNLNRLSETRNGLGLVQKQKFDRRNQPVEVTDRNGVTTTNTFDTLGRVIAKASPNVGSGTRLESFQWSPRGLVAYIDPLNKTNLFTYDELGRKLTELNANGESLQFTYLPAGDLATMTDGKSQVSTWAYDVHGRILSKKFANGSTNLIYSYNAIGLVTNRWSQAKGNTTYTYDSTGNLIFVNYPSIPDVTFAYDSLNRVTNMIDAVGTTKFSFSDGLLGSEVTPWSSGVVTYGYNLARLRNQFSLSQPGGGVFTNAYAYDGGRRLINVTSQAGSFDYYYANNGSYASSRVQKQSIPVNSGLGSLYITNIYDLGARLLSTSLISSNTAIVESINYQIDNRDQVTQISRDTRENGNYDYFTTYLYDSIGQLSSAYATNLTGGSPQSIEQNGYSFDAAWNLAQKTNNGTLIVFTNNVLNQIVKVGSSGVSYDSNGNLTVDNSGVNYGYDDDNRLKSIEVVSSSKTEFTYDGYGRLRIRKESIYTGGTYMETGQTRYIYDGMRVIQERNSSNIPVVSYTRGNDLSGTFQGAGGVGGLLSRSVHSGTSPYAVNSSAHYHSDGNGNIVYLVKPDHSLGAEYRYDSFGNTISSAGPLKDDNVYRFSSKELITSIKIYYYGYRFYNPNLQRWMTRDVLGEIGSVNLYRLGNNAVFGWCDPLGLKDVNIFIWDWQKAGVYWGRVGHVLVKDHGTTNVLLSLFPHGPGEESRSHGTNNNLNLACTIAEEGGRPKWIYKIHVPNDDAFNAAVKDHSSRQYWNWLPTKTNETHCTRAAYDCLKAGGVGVSGQDSGQIIPGKLQDILDKLAKDPESGVIRIK